MALTREELLGRLAIIAAAPDRADERIGADAWDVMRLLLQYLDDPEIARCVYRMGMEPDAVAHAAYRARRGV